MVPIDLTVDISQQLLPLFDGDAALQDPSVALPVELAINVRATEPPFCPLVVPHGGDSRGKASSSQLEGQALLLDL